MAKLRIRLKTDIASEVLPRALSKSERRQIQIIENAIRLCAREGVEALAYERIAKECGVTRHLVMHYFPDRDALVERAMEYVWASLKLEILTSIDREKGAVAKLKAYLASNFHWARKHPSQMLFVTLFLHYAATKREFLSYNSQLMRLGQERILGILQAGLAEGAFIQLPDPALEAKSIQLAVLGLLVSSVTDTAATANQADLELHLEQTVLSRLKR